MVNVPWDHERDEPMGMSDGNLSTESVRSYSAKAVEKERLRFEGDLDRWMKMLGTGISGYQPEAYAAMDAACRELKRLRIAIIAAHEPLAAFDEPYEYLSDDKAWRLAIAVIDAIRPFIQQKEAAI